MVDAEQVAVVCPASIDGHEYILQAVPVQDARIVKETGELLLIK